MLFGAGAGAVQTRGVLSHQLVVLRSFFINCHPEPVEGSQQYDKAEMEFDNDVAHSLRCFTSFRMTIVIRLRCFVMLNMIKKHPG